jgi:hypothetical protein
VCCSLAFVSWIFPYCLSCGPSMSRYRNSDSSYRNKRTMLLFPRHPPPQQMKEKNSIPLCGIVLLFQEDLHCLQCQNNTVYPVVLHSPVLSMEMYERNYCGNKAQRDWTFVSFFYTVLVLLAFLCNSWPSVHSKITEYNYLNMVSDIVTVIRICTIRMLLNCAAKLIFSLVGEELYFFLWSICKY